MTKVENTSSQKNMVDLNVLPDRHRKRKTRLLTAGAFLVWAILLGLLYPAGRSFWNIQQEYARQRTAFTQLKSEVENYEPVGDRLDSLETQIEEANQQAESIKSVLNETQYDRTKWSSLLSTVLESTPPGVEIGNLNQNTNRIEINGSSTSYQNVLGFKENLENGSGFSRAQIRSIVLISEENTSEVPSPVGTSTSSSYSFQITAYTPGEVNQP